MGGMTSVRLCGILLSVVARNTLVLGASCGTAGVFDFYIFARFYDRSYYQCGTYAAENLTLHGLWPSYLDPTVPDGCVGPWPQFCGGNNSAINTLQNATVAEFKDRWADVAPSYANGLGQHEWEKHGTCYTKNLTNAAQAPDPTTAIVDLQISYMSAMLGLLDLHPTPEIIHQAMTSGVGIPLADLEAAFGPEKPALSCYSWAGVTYLDMVEFCYDQKDGLPTERIDCPDVVLTSGYDNGCVVDGDSLVFVNQSCQSSALV